VVIGCSFILLNSISASLKAPHPHVSLSLQIYSLAMIDGFLIDDTDATPRPGHTHMIMLIRSNEVVYSAVRRS
jgi:hypothetical protein